MAITALAVDDDRSDDIEALSSVSARDLARLYDVLAAFERSFPRYGDLESSIAKVVGKDKSGTITKALVSLRRFSDRKKIPSSEVVEALESGLRKYGWSAEQLQRFANTRDALARLINLNVLHNTYKLVDLYYDVDRHLHSMRITVDAKPVFDFDRSRIGCFILYSVLKLTYSDSHEDERELSITLEREELEQLRDECEAALKKLRTAGVEIEGRMNASTLVFDSVSLFAQED